MRRASLFLPLLLACGGDPVVERPPPPENEGIHSFASGCYALDATEPGSSNTRWLASAGDVFSFTAKTAESGARFRLQPADLGTYLFYDSAAGYLTADETGFPRVTVLESDVTLVDDSFISPAEWDLEVSAHDATRFQLHHKKTGHYLSPDGLTADVANAAVVALYPQEGCADFPELTLDATGRPAPRTFPDGALFGIVETHTHMFSNFGFGGGGIFHGSPFHRLGVEHALGSCEGYHGKDGRRDLVGYAFSGLDNLDPDALIPVLITGMTPEFDHHTDGYPTFTDWPSSWGTGTHQTQYHRWVERAYLSGLRLLVNHATTNSVLCDLVVGLGAQRVRYACNDMIAVDREIEEAHALERYIDAQSGGPGRGWFRIVTSPAQARQVIGEGKLAVILGIETSNLFDCFLTPPAGVAPCDADSVRAALDRYREKGVRAIFPVHKFDNAFSAGDGDRNVGQLGSFVNSGHFSNFVSDCPDLPSAFDRGRLLFGGLNMPRENYLDPAPNDMSGFGINPVAAVVPFLEEITAGPLEGEYCQKTGLTPLGETLILELMKRGMILEVDHLPRRSFARAYELLEANDYPPAGTHANTNNGKLYDLGGVSKFNFRRCADPARTGSLADPLRDRMAQIADHGAYPAEGFGFDLNGFAGGPRPRFGPDSECGEVPQSNPVTYPFTSYDGTVTFSEPHLGDRTLDFNTVGMLHIGLLPELIEEVRRDGTTDAELEPLFKSAEGYLRMWEKAEARGAALSKR